jgi:hypothetical protein
VKYVSSTRISSVTEPTDKKSIRILWPLMARKKLEFLEVHRFLLHASYTFSRHRFGCSILPCSLFTRSPCQP